MKRDIRAICASTLIALGISTTPAHAASGFSVTPQQGQRVNVGMTADEVQRLLGRPQSNVKYRNEPGPLWAYTVIGAVDPTFFSVSFGADGKVVATREYPDLTAYDGK